MKYTIIIFAICMSLIIGCDEDSNFNINSDPEPNEKSSSCSTTEDVTSSECPAELLTNMCTTYSCNYTIGNIAADGSFPPCPGDANSCDFVDCTTLICGGSISYNISVSEGSLGYTFDSIDPTTGETIEVRVICFEEGFLSFECGEGGTIFNEF